MTQESNHAGGKASVLRDYTVKYTRRDGHKVNINGRHGFGNYKRRRKPLVLYSALPYGYSRHVNLEAGLPLTSIEFRALSPAMQRDIEQAVRCLRDGGVVAFPTDTLYGLGADALNPSALERVFAIKERPPGLALPALIDGWDQMAMVSRDVPEAARLLAERFWPGPLTLIVTKAAHVPGRLTADGPTVAVRMPDHPVPRAIARRLGRPITGTSANVSGQPDPRTLEELFDQLGRRLDYVVSSGPSPAGTASTVVDITGETPKLLRQGAVSLESVAAVLPQLAEG